MYQLADRKRQHAQIDVLVSSPEYYSSRGNGLCHDRRCFRGRSRLVKHFLLDSHESRFRQEFHDGGKFTESQAFYEIRYVWVRGREVPLREKQDDRNSDRN